MTHNELLAKVNEAELSWYYVWMQDVVRAVVELHKPVRTPDGCGDQCAHCITDYPCPIIQAIEKELK